MWPCITSLEAGSTLSGHGLGLSCGPGCVPSPSTRGLYPLGTWHCICSLDAKDVDFFPSMGAADWKWVTGSI